MAPSTHRGFRTASLLALAALTAAVVSAGTAMAVTRQTTPHQTSPAVFEASPDDATIAAFQDTTGHPMVELRTRSELTTSGNEWGRGAVRLHDSIANRTLDIGWYEYGAGIFSETMLELYLPVLSVLPFEGSPNPGRIDVRNSDDTLSGVYFLGDGQIGTEKAFLDVVLGNPGPGEERYTLARLMEASGLETSLLIQTAADGSVEMRRVELGPVDSAGDGYRILRVAN